LYNNSIRSNDLPVPKGEPGKNFEKVFYLLLKLQKLYHLYVILSNVINQTPDNSSV